MNCVVFSYDVKEYEKIAPKKEIKAILDDVCDEIGLDNCEFSVSFVSESHIHALNKEYRNIDDSTDILSFAVMDEVDGFSFITPSNRKKNIGDMLICPEVMKKNAQIFGQDINCELKRLLIHGVLHLSGENHLTNDMNREPMLIKQEKILKKLS